MHVMGRYRMSGSMDDLMCEVDRRFAAQLSPEPGSGSKPKPKPGSGSERGPGHGEEGDGVAGDPVRVPPGIVGYQAVRTGADTLLTIRVFESGELLDRVQQAAADIRTALAGFDLEELGTLTGSVDISRVSDSFLSPVHPG